MHFQEWDIRGMHYQEWNIRGINSQNWIIRVMHYQDWLTCLCSGLHFSPYNYICATAFLSTYFWPASSLFFSKTAVGCC